MGKIRKYVEEEEKGANCNIRKLERRKREWERVEGSK